MNNTTTAANHPDYSQAIEYALERLRNELPPTLSYHNSKHTEHDVLPAARRLGQLAGLSKTEQGLLEISAAYHDIGQIYTSHGHEAVSIKIMAEALPRFGFAPPDIERVTALIMATRMPQSPKNELEQLLADADMDGLGRDDFLETSMALWRENAALGRPQSWTQWLETQIRFLRSHRYFSAPTRALREEGKQRNIAMVEGLLRDAQNESSG